jgi:hypothetical protein
MVAPDGPLRLRAEDAADLAVISAMVQDALISVKDMTYDRAARQFTVVANRFRWETTPDAKSDPKNIALNGTAAAYERTLCAVLFGGVDRISYRGFRRRDDDRILSLLAIREGEKPGNIDLEFSGNATLRLEVSNIQVHATDIGEAWPTAWQPDHNASDPS